MSSSYFFLIVENIMLHTSRPVPSPQILDLIFCSIRQKSCHPKHVLSSQWMKSVCVKVTGEFARITKVSKLEPGSETARWRVGASWNWFWYLHSYRSFLMLSCIGAQLNANLMSPSDFWGTWILAQGHQGCISGFDDIYAGFAATDVTQLIVYRVKFSEIGR